MAGQEELEYLSLRTCDLLLWATVEGLNHSDAVGSRGSEKSVSSLKIADVARSKMGHVVSRTG
jgi:hypothetical protein